MAIDLILDALDGVDEAQKAFYAEKDGKFVLDPDKYAEAKAASVAQGLKAKNDELLGEKKAAAAKAKEAEEAAARIAEEAAKKTGDLEALEKSWGGKLTKAEEGYKATIAAQQKAIEGLTIGAAAKDIAAEMAVQGSASLLERVVRDRLSVEMGEDGPKIRVMDANGKPSALSLDDLKNELRGDPALKPIITASKANGGGAAGANGGAGTGKMIAASELEKMTPAQKAAFFKANPGVSVQT